MRVGERGPLPLDLRRIAEPVQHDIDALGGERGRDPEPDPARRAGHDRGLSVQRPWQHPWQHPCSPWPDGWPGGP